jgi:hypothetical protein
MAWQERLHHRRKRRVATRVAARFGRLLLVSNGVSLEVDMVVPTHGGEWQHGNISSCLTLEVTKVAFSQSASTKVSSTQKAWHFEMSFNVRARTDDKLRQQPHSQSRTFLFSSVACHGDSEARTEPSASCPYAASSFVGAVAVASRIAFQSLRNLLTGSSDSYRALPMGSDVDRGHVD